MGRDGPDSEVKVRPATAGDLPALNDIYNHYVLTSTVTYQLEPESLEARQRWLAAHDQRHPVVVAEIGETVVGWGCLSPFHARAAYAATVENSVYVRHDLHRRGVGSAILCELLEAGRRQGHRTVVAVIDAEQAASIAFHERHGFVRVAHLREVGFKFGRWLDVVYMQRML